LQAGTYTETVTIGGNPRVAPETFTVTATVIKTEIPITSLRIDSLAITTMARGQKLSFGLLLNEGATGENVIWAISDSSFGFVDNTGEVTIYDRTGNLRLTATDPVSGLSHSIMLRIVS